ncbi:MAG: alpha/beta fold hydrolase [Candidatus Omnitrophota bacterium]
MEKKSGVVTTEDKQKIYFDHYQDGHDKVAVIAHGFFNSKNSELIKELAEELTEFIDVIAFDFRGHGASEGLFHWTSKEYLDLEAVLKIANAKYEKTGLIGFSLGAATSIITLKHKPKVDSLIAVSAPTEFEKIDYKFWNLNVENDIFYNLGEGRKGKGVRPGPFWLKKDKPINVVKDLKIPILYIHGDADWVILPWHSEMLYKNTTSNKKHIVIIPNASHAEYLMRFHEVEFIEAVRRWFEETL